MNILNLTREGSVGGVHAYSKLSPLLPLFIMLWKNCWGEIQIILCSVLNRRGIILQFLKFSPPISFNNGIQFYRNLKLLTIPSFHYPPPPHTHNISVFNFSTK